MKKRLFIIISFFLASVLTAQTALAQSTDLYNLSITPPTAYLKIHPGNVSLHTITVKNNGQASVTVTPKLVDFVSDGATGKPILANNSSFPYLDLDKTSFDKVTVAPGQSARLTLHFSIPSTAENHEYPLTVLFEARLPDEAQNDTKVAGTIGSNIVILISDTDTLEQQFDISSFNTGNVIDSFQPLEFSPLVKNNSYAAGVASGSAQITNWQGTVVAQYEVLPEVVLGYSTRKIQPIADSDSAGTLRTNKDGQRIFSYKSAFLIGPHTISVFLPSGDTNKPELIEYKKVVWAIPIAFIIAVVIASILVTLYYVIRKKRYKL